MRTLSLSSAVRDAAACEFLDGLSPVGQNPLDLTIVTKAWAGPDDCDYNRHLSNSSYPKVLDMARMKSALIIFPYYARTGGWIALAATHFHFIREIPFFARYEIRSQIVGWDHKWLYIVHRFVTHRKPTPRSSGNKNEASTTSAASTSNGIPPSSASAAPIPSIHTPSTPLANLHNRSITRMVYGH
jgi:acyl-CoA thioesterase FadM